ncbi:MAG: response regulator [Kofleriaceae bacterium]|nr:response regulator [Kofleriaceae bacterium]
MNNLVSGAIMGLDDLPIASAIFELDGTILYVNEANARMFGRTVADFIGKKSWDYVPGAEHIWPDVVEGARVHGTFRGEIAIAMPAGTQAIHYVATLRPYEGRTVVVVFSIEHTPSEEAQRATDASAKQRLESLGLVAGGIAHDFNNQLVSVLAEASAVREDPALGEPVRSALRRIEAAANRMAQLTRQLLAYAGRGRFVTERVDADDLVREAHDQLARMMPPSAELEIAPGAGRSIVEADRGLLLQVLLNLVANAAESLRAKGRVKITTGAPTRDDGTRWWSLTVSDNGSGIDARTVARVFDPFFTTKTEHHGLGLSAVHGIIRRLGGEISVDSQVGRGSTFAVRLPVVAGEPHCRRTPTQPLPLLSLRDKRVLVADDEPIVRATLRRLLERRGAIVVTANDGAEAAERLADGQYTLVCLDVMMPQLTGYQLLPIARRAQPVAPVLMMSGYTDASKGSGGGDDEPDLFLEKPFTAKAFDAAVDALLERDVS